MIHLSKYPSVTRFYLSVKNTIVPHKRSKRSKRSTALEPAWNTTDQLIMDDLLKTKLKDLGPFEILDECLRSGNFTSYLTGSTKVLKVNDDTALSPRERQKLCKIYEIASNEATLSNEAIVSNEGTDHSELLKSWFLVKHKLSECTKSHSVVAGTDPPTDLRSFITNSEDQPSPSATLEGMNTSAAQTTPNGVYAERQALDIYNNGAPLFSPSTHHEPSSIATSGETDYCKAEVGFPSRPPSRPPSVSFQSPPQHPKADETKADTSQHSSATDVDSQNSEKPVTRRQARQQSASSSASPSATGSSSRSQSVEGRRVPQQKPIHPDRLYSLRIEKDLVKNMKEILQQRAAGNKPSSTN